MPIVALVVRNDSLLPAFMRGDVLIVDIPLRPHPDFYIASVFENRVTIAHFAHPPATGIILAVQQAL